MFLKYIIKHLPLLTATKMVLNPVVCHDAVAALHEVCDGCPDVLMGDQAASFQVEFVEAHPPFLNQLVDHHGDAGVPAVARVFLQVRESLHLQLVASYHCVQFISLMD